VLDKTPVKGYKRPYDRRVVKTNEVYSRERLELYAK
jgi:hypothetical protein